MPAIRVGDSWTFDVPRTPFVRGQYVFCDLGSLPAEETLHGFMTARVTWDDPLLAYERLLAINIELAAYAAGGTYLSDWDNGLFIVQDRRYYTDGHNDRHDQPLVAQAILTLPPNAALLRLSLLDQSGDDAGPSPVLEEARLVFSVVSTR
jgi:hypothetical protein